MTLQKSPVYPVLIVDDEQDALHSFELALKSFGITNILTCQDSRNVLGILQIQPIELILLDMTMPYINGEELLPEIKQNFPQIPVIVITGKNDIDSAVNCIKNGALDYLVKPVEKNRLKTTIFRQLEYNRIKQEALAIKTQLLNPQGFNAEFFRTMITRNTRMQSIFKYVMVVAKSMEPILITGETGVGKELMAQAIHKASGRVGEFTSINVSGLDDTVFSDTLFGHKKGAFTDAYQHRNGLVDQAKGGTLFLDEIGDLSMASQIKLLRLLQESEYYPLGSDVTKKADIRIVAATNRHIKELESDSSFRQDLFFRLYVHHIEIPPLRERPDDIPALVNHFLEEANRTLQKNCPDFPPDAYPLLMSYDFPGNIRELRAAIFDAVGSYQSGSFFLKKIRARIKDQNHKSKPQSTAPFIINGSNADLFFQSSLPTIAQVEKMLIQIAMQKAKGNQTVACELLGIARQTLNKKLKSMTCSAD